MAGSASVAANVNVYDSAMFVPDKIVICYVYMSRGD